MEWNVSKETMWWIIGVVIALVVIIAAWWLFTGKPAAKDAMKPAGTTTAQTTDGATVATGASVASNAGESISVKDQPAGDTVRVAQAQLSRVSWIAVRDDMRIFGAKRVDAENGGQTFNDIDVPLLKDTEAGKTYRVVVYADDGDQIFDFKKDALVEGLSGSFTTTNGD